MDDNPEIILKDLTSFGEKLNESTLVSQAHARAILSENSDSETNWPNFSNNLDKRVYYSSNYLILEGINLLIFKEHETLAKKYLKQGAESLEFLYRYPRIDDSIKLNVLIKSIFAYYISSNYAQAYVLTKELEHEELDSLPLLNLLFKILKKDLKNARIIIMELLTDEKFNDEKITSELAEGSILEEEAISRVLTHSTFKAVSIFLEYIKTGLPDLFDSSRNIIDISLKLAQKYKLVDYWWLIFCYGYILDEFHDRNLWVNLETFMDEKFITRYIKSYLRHDPPIIELWPSQIDSLPFINDNDNRSFCLKMPTSAGKTQIAELTILKYLIERKDDDSQCIYIAPFRSLAAQVEKNLRQSIGSLGFKISEIYGGFDLNPVDDLLIKESKILVMTPEKFDALIRYKPEIRDNIGLIIIDEGHIIDPNQRGLNFEFFLQRLLNYYKDKNCRFLFISAVLPNAKDFAKWITGSSEQLAKSDWRPSRLMLGRLVWNGHSARINYTHEYNEKFRQKCFIPNFIEQINCRELPGILRRNPYPKTAKECLAHSALLFAQEGTTLVFAGQKREVKPFGEELVKALNIYKASKREKGEEFDLISPEQIIHIEKCKTIIRSELGNESYLLDFLSCGFIVHHGGLPHKVRIAIEDLVRSNGVNLIIATSTLAEGVNLPIKAVLVKSIQHNYGSPIDPLKFWNICGRAGRAGKENEGQILFLIDGTEDKKRRDKKQSAINKLIYNLNSSKVISSIFTLFAVIVNRWQITYPNTDLSELCDYLANQSNDWIHKLRERHGRFNNSMLTDLMDRLDSQLLSLVEESDTNIDPDQVSELLQESLLFIQIEKYPTKVISKDLVTEMLKSRLNYIYSEYPDSDVRRSFYKLGLKLSDCDIIEENWEDLYDLLSLSYDWDEFYLDEQIKLLIDISEFLFNLNDINGDNELPSQWKKILELWLNGYNVAEMVKDEEIKEFEDDPVELREFIEKFFVYRLSWGFNSILNYFSIFSNTKLPIISSYFPAMIKNGVISPNAVCILPYLDQERYKSLKIASFCPFSYEKPKKIIRWFKNLNKEDLNLDRIDSQEIEQIIDIRNKFIDYQYSENILEIDFYSDNDLVKSLNSGDHILVIGESINPTSIQIFTLDGKLIDIVETEDRFPEWIFGIDLVTSEITEIDQEEDFYTISIVVKR